MYDWELTALAVMYGAVFCGLSFMLGWIFCDVHTDKIARSKKESEKQQKMWNEYLEALRGGQNAKNADAGTK